MLSYTARTLYKYWQRKFITSFPKQHREPLRRSGGRAARTVHLGEGLTALVLSQSQAALPLWLRAVGGDEQNGQRGFGSVSQEEIYLSIRQTGANQEDSMI